jgi:ribosomal-protein-alanine N-acetyltransferase
MPINKNVGMSITRPPSIYYKQASDRLLFRSITLDDIEPWSEFCNKEDYQRFVGADISLSSKLRATQWIEKQIERETNKEFGQLAVVEKSSGNFIGVGGIICRSINEISEYEITYSLIPRFWGKGYATELAIHFRNFAVENIETNSVISMIVAENIASNKVASNNGMTPDGKTIFMGMELIIHRHTFAK